jgi:predicted AAA+ superfamily ATPase
MVFLTGPRQVGKTSLGLAIAEEQERFVYLNYDNFSHREVIHKVAWLPEVQGWKPSARAEIRLSGVFPVIV